MRKEEGFTLIELLVAMGLVALLMTLSASSLRQFWWAQSLEGASDVLVGELRAQQEDSVSQSHPLVFGVGFTTGETEMIIYSFNPAGAGACSARPKGFDAGVFNAAVRIKAVAITNDTSASEYVTCQAARPTDGILFFYARGTSTGGTVTLEQPNYGRQRGVSVSGITGRVTRS